MQKSIRKIDPFWNRIVMRFGKILGPKVGDHGGSTNHLFSIRYPQAPPGPTKTSQDLSKIDFGTILNRSGIDVGPIWGPSRFKIGPKTHPKFKRLLIAKKWPSKPVLDPSWGDLGSFWMPCWGPKYRSGISGRKICWILMFLMVIGFRNAFWSDFGPTWPPKRPKMTPRWHPKTTQNRSQIDVQKYTRMDSKKGRLRSSGHEIMAGVGDRIGPQERG